MVVVVVEPPAAGAPVAPAGGVSAGGVAAGGADSLEEAAGGVVSAAGAGVVDSCFEQAASASAATRALRASLVFIEQYPEEEFGNGGERP